MILSGVSTMDPYTFYPSTDTTAAAAAATTAAAATAAAPMMAPTVFAAEPAMPTGE